MSRNRTYSEYHPRWYRPRISTWWWLGRWPYLTFILRELSSVFVGWFVIFLLIFVNALIQGEAGYTWFLEFAKHPVVVVLNVVTLFFITFHAITWLNLAPKAMVVRMGGKRVPPESILIGNYAAWAVVSVVVAWLILRGAP
jgi:succinate dehydrogenase subunit C